MGKNEAGMMALDRATLAKIHIAKKELGINDDAYRDILGLSFGVSSAKDLNAGQGRALLYRFRLQGWKPKKGTAAPRSRKRDGDYIEIKAGQAAARQRKILAMWNALGYGIDKIHARVKRQFGVERFEWLVETQDLHILITDLEARCRQAGIETKQ